jgi:DNA primase
MMEYSGLSYVDAIEDLARSAGLVVPREERSVRDVIKQKQAIALGEVMNMASDWYAQQLKGSQRAIDYLKGRGLTGEIAKRYALGYAQDGWQGLEAVFNSYSNDETAKILQEAGLMIQGENSDSQGNAKRYDRFRDRIMFPIRNPKGQVIAFGGRILDQGEPKYLNSPETPLFSKGNTLYGLFEGRKAIRDQGYVLVCEGYMDVVALAQLGFANAVATLGTACTPFHARTLLRQTDRIVFSFDGDSAGQRAAQRALEASLPILGDDKEIRFLFLPSEHDPDSYIRQYGTAAFEQAVSQATPLSGFFFKLASDGNDLSSPEGRAKTHYTAKPLLQAMPPIALRSQLLRELANRTASSVGELEQFCGLPKLPTQSTPSSSGQVKQSSQQNSLGTQEHTYRKTGQAAKQAGTQYKPSLPKLNQPPKAPTDLSEHIMRLLIQYPVLGKEMDPAQRMLALSTAKTRSTKAFELMDDLLQQCDSLHINESNPNSYFAVFQDQLSSRPLADLYEILRQRVLGSDSDFAGAKADLDGVFQKLERSDLKAAMTEIAQKMANNEASPADIARYRELGEKLAKG